MRLNCPNCAAEYEVPDSVIPTEGRDLQCSNCGHTWFFKPGMAMAPTVEIDPDTRVDPEARQKAEAQRQAAAEAKAEVEAEVAAAQAEAAAHNTPSDPPRKPMDPTLAGILREEANREMSARKAEGRAPVEEVQEELGLPATAPPQANVQPAPAPKPDGRDSGRFPDIEEINASLAPGATAPQRADQDHKAKRSRARGFRLGLAFVIIIAIVMLLLYVYPVTASEMFPGVKEEIAAYVVWVDGIRLWLDQQLSGLLSTMRDAAQTDTPADGS